jgi:tetratricopeptide (TPR) repeat protein
MTHTLFQILLIVILVIRSCSSSAEEYRPQHQNEVIYTIPAQSNLLKIFNTYSPRQEQHSLLEKETVTKTILLAKKTGDERYYGRSLAALNELLRDFSSRGDLFTLRGIVKQAIHDFRGALSDFERALHFDRRQSQALLSKAAVHLVLGEYQDALSSCNRLFLIVDPLLQLACVTSVISMTGEAKSSYNHLNNAYTKSSLPQDKEVIIWIEHILGDIAERLGDTKSAEAHYKKGLDTVPESLQLNIAYADLLIREERYQEILTLYSTKVVSDSLALRVAYASKKQLSLSPSNEIKQLFEKTVSKLSITMNKIAERGDNTHLRELSWFNLYINEDALHALSLAKENWKTQKEALDLRLYAETALHVNDNSSLKTIEEYLKSTKREDVVVDKILNKTVRIM